MESMKRCQESPEIPTLNLSLRRRQWDSEVELQCHLLTIKHELKVHQKIMILKLIFQFSNSRSTERLCKFWLGLTCAIIINTTGKPIKSKQKKKKKR